MLIQMWKYVLADMTKKNSGLQEYNSLKGLSLYNNLEVRYLRKGWLTVATML